MNVNGVKHHTQSHDLRRTDLFLLLNRLASQIHVNTPRCFMSIFLLKSDGGLLRNIHFNVFVTVVCSSHHGSNI